MAASFTPTAVAIATVATAPHRTAPSSPSSPSWSSRSLTTPGDPNRRVPPFAGGACAGPGPAVDLQQAMRTSPPARWVLAPDEVVESSTSWATIAYAAAPRGSAPVTSL
jgi:hypothetical protein